MLQYDRYGLVENPFEGEVLASPKEGDAERYVSVHRVDMRKIKKRIMDDVIKRRPILYVVCGRSGSGRTVMARRLVAIYVRRWSRFNKCERKVAYDERKNDGNLDARQVARDVLNRLAEETEDLGAPFRDGPVEQLRTDLIKLGGSVDDMRAAAKKFSRTVHDLNGTFGCVIENVPNIEILRGLRILFEKTQGIVVCTITEEQRSAVLLPLLDGKELSQEAEIRLEKLGPAEACKLAERRWRQWHATPPLPFDRDALRKTFEARRRTVGKSLNTLSFMIRTRLTDNVGDEHWPHKTLEFNAKQIENYFDLFDSGRHD